MAHCSRAVPWYLEGFPVFCNASFAYSACKGYGRHSGSMHAPVPVFAHHFSAGDVIGSGYDIRGFESVSHAERKIVDPNTEVAEYAGTWANANFSLLSFLMSRTNRTWEGRAVTMVLGVDTEETWNNGCGAWDRSDGWFDVKID
eukprot:317952_1